jgi:hypothetical protein
MLSSTIHQIWLDGEFDLLQNHAHLHQNWTTMNKLHDNNTQLWSSEMIEKLIESDYPHLRQTYDSYEHTAFKTNFAKFIVLHKFGGFVVDIDCKPKKCLYGLLNDSDIRRHFLPLVVNDTNPYKCRSSRKFINTFCIYMPYAEHPLMNLILAEAPKAARRKPFECDLAYLLRSVGAYFLTACIKKYKKQTQKELKKPRHKAMIHDVVSSRSDLRPAPLSPTTSTASSSSSTWSLRPSFSWRRLSESVSSRSELKGKVHTKHVVNLLPVSTIDFYLYHEDSSMWLGEHWERSLKRRQRAKLSSAELAVIAVCVGVLVVVL